MVTVKTKHGKEPAEAETGAGLDWVITTTTTGLTKRQQMVCFAIDHLFITFFVLYIIYTMGRRDDQRHMSSSYGCIELLM